MNVRVETPLVKTSLPTEIRPGVPSGVTVVSSTLKIPSPLRSFHSLMTRTSVSKPVPASSTRWDSQRAVFWSVWTRSSRIVTLRSFCLTSDGEMSLKAISTVLIVGTIGERPL